MKEIRQINLKRVSLHLNIQGPPKGIPLLCLHGFPDTHHTWEPQISFLTDKGYRLIMPNQRGYQHSDKPPLQNDYHLPFLGQDMLALLDELGLEKVNILAHDWGGVIGWWLAHHCPERIQTLTILNSPHPRPFRQLLKQNLKQIYKSKHVFLFQLPCLPEYLLGFNHCALLLKTIRENDCSGRLKKADLKGYLDAWQEKGALKAMVNWYRANLFKKSPWPQTKIKCPVQIIWGEQDPFLSIELGKSGLSETERGQFIGIQNAGHWVHWDQTDQVNQAVHRFISSSQPETL